MLTPVTIFTPYPFTIGEKIHISEGPRHGDWIVAGLDDKKVTLRCPVSGKEFCWDRFCHVIETKEQEWPEHGKNKIQSTKPENSPMQIGMIGLGRMGMNMARRLLRGGHQIVAFNRTPDKTEQLAKEGATGAYSLQELVESLPSPKVVWLMLPAGKPVDDHLTQLQKLLSPGDIIVEGGNSRYKDDIRRVEALQGSGIHYIDAGVSGGIWGLKVGYCTMVGGEEPIFHYLEPILQTLAPKDGYLYCGPTGAGHFVKMIHNGIEYGMMQAYGEGFALLEASPYGQNLDYGRISHLWNQGSVIRSWLLELLENAFAEDPHLEAITGHVDDSGEGRWTVEEAIESGVAAPVITMALFQRFQSRKENAFENRVLAALRREFGGHAVKKIVTLKDTLNLK